MRFVPPLEEGRLVRRYKRFLAEVVTLQGETLSIHCPNTGAMRNCMPEQARVWFQRSADPRRKLPATWELVEVAPGRLACINTGRANALVAEALQAGVIAELAGFTALRREVPCGVEGSRMDFRLDYPAGPAYVEVKSVTLGFADSTVAAFPDAVTMRGARHLRSLAVLARSGIRAVLLYCVNLEGVEAVRPACEIDPVYAEALQAARRAGVEVLAYGAALSPQELRLTRRLALLD